MQATMTQSQSRRRERRKSKGGMKRAIRYLANYRRQAALPYVKQYASRGGEWKKLSDQVFNTAKGGAPVFLYRVEGLSVEDTMQPAKDGKSWKRTLTVRAEPGRGAADGWMFRGLGRDAKPVPLPWKDGTAVIEEAWKP